MTNKKNSAKCFHFLSSEPSEKVLLCFTLELKKILESGLKLRVEIPERVYLDLKQKDFKEIFSDQMLQLGSASDNLREVLIVRENVKKSQVLKEEVRVVYL